MAAEKSAKSAWSLQFKGKFAFTDVVGQIDQVVNLDDDVLLFIDDNSIYKIDANLKKQRVLVAGKKQGYKDGTALEAEFDNPSGLAVLPNGDVLVADTLNNRIRRLSANLQSVSTLTGSSVYSDAHIDGEISSATFNMPSSLAVLNDGRVLISEASNRLRLLNAALDNVSTLSSNGSGYKDGLIKNAQFKTPGYFTVLPDGRVVVVDEFNNKLRLLSADLQSVSTVANDDLLLTEDDLGSQVVGVLDNNHIVVCSGRNLYLVDIKNNTVHTVQSSELPLPISLDDKCVFVHGRNVHVVFDSQIWTFTSEKNRTYNLTQHPLIKGRTHALVALPDDVVALSDTHGFTYVLNAVAVLNRESRIKTETSPAQVPAPKVPVGWSSPTSAVKLGNNNILIVDPSNRTLYMLETTSASDGTLTSFMMFDDTFTPYSAVVFDINTVLIGGISDSKTATVMQIDIETKKITLYWEVKSERSPFTNLAVWDNYIVATAQNTLYCEIPSGALMQKRFSNNIISLAVPGSKSSGEPILLVAEEFRIWEWNFSKDSYIFSNISRSFDSLSTWLAQANDEKDEDADESKKGMPISIKYMTANQSQVTLLLSNNRVLHYNHA